MAFHRNEIKQATIMNIILYNDINYDFRCIM